SPSLSEATRMMRLLIRATAAVAIITPIVSGCSRSSAAPVATAVPPNVAVAKVARGDIAQTIAVTAEFRPYQEIDVHAKVAGYVKSIGVDVGDHVKAGQLLAVLEIPELQDELQQAEGGVKRAEQQIDQARADLARAQSVHEVAHLNAQRLANVMQARPNLVAQQDIDDATGRDRVSEAQVTTAQAALAAAESQLDIAKAEQSKTQALYSYAQITAPFAGVITHRYADTGAMIQAGTSSQTQAMPLVRLSDLARLRLVIPVPESAVHDIRIGTPVQLDVETLHKTFAGKVSRFADRLDTDTRTMRVEVDVENPQLEIVPGMFANASIVLNEAKGVLVAPVEAIERDETSSRVFVIDGSHRVASREVTVGLEAADRAEITSGLAAGDLVVVGNRSQLKPGIEVAPVVSATVASAAGGR